MSEQTAELNALYRERNELRADVARLGKEREEHRKRREYAEQMRALSNNIKKQAEAQRDSLKAQVQEWMEGSAQLQVKLDEAERLLDLCRVHLPIEGPQGELRKDVVAFLAGLSTITPADWAGHQRERAEGGGKTEAELRKQYGLTPRCEFGCTIDKGGQHHPGCAEVVAKGCPA